jgi:prepilin-type N-terminal cleavage/methylation domain-containing protein
MTSMNFTAQTKIGPQRLAVQWLDAPSVGPLSISGSKAGYGAGSPWSAARATELSRRPYADRLVQRSAASGFFVRSLRAFTLLELMMVIAIIGFIAALTLPHVAGFGKANSMTAATRQMLDDVALARQRAMVNRSTVYMVFLPPMFWNNVSYSLNMTGQQVSNLVMHQYSAYALVSLATVGDQPGQHHPQYITDWRFLPSGVFIAPFEFSLAGAVVTTTNTLVGTTNAHVILPWSTITVPFPSLYSTNTFMSLPCIGFTPQGSLTSSLVRQYEYIALARGSIFYPTDTNGQPLFQPPNLAEVPPNNDVNNPNVIQIDGITARPILVQNQFQ